MNLSISSFTVFSHPWVELKLYPAALDRQEQLWFKKPQTRRVCPHSFIKYLPDLRVFRLARPGDLQNAGFLENLQHHHGFYLDCACGGADNFWTWHKKREVILDSSAYLSPLT